jgi:DNA polymerase-4
VPGFIDTLPIQKVPGVGKKTYRQLELMGITKLGDINKYPQKTLLDRLGKFGKRLMDLAAGNDRSRVTPYSRHKSVSSERTLAEDTRDKSLLKRYLLKQAEEVARHLRKSGRRGKTITIKLKHADFKQVTRSITIGMPTQSSKKIFQHAASLLDDYQAPKKLRLIGVGVSNLISTEMPVQMDLFEHHKNRGGGWTQVDRTVEDITKKFGRDAIKRATFKNESS